MFNFVYSGKGSRFHRHRNAFQLGPQARTAAVSLPA
jgi:hypothetical protein